MTRLAQYKVLERRQAGRRRPRATRLRSCARAISPCGSSTISARISTGAVELINRTNQLNFTKKRLPEDRPGGARRR